MILLFITLPMPRLACLLLHKSWAPREHMIEALNFFIQKTLRAQQHVWEDKLFVGHIVDAKTQWHRVHVESEDHQWMGRTGR